MADIEIGMSVIKSMAHEIAQEVLEEISKEKPEIKDRIESYDDGYQQGARDFAEWLLVNHTLDCIECNHGDKSINCKECAKEYIAEWQKQ